MSSELGELAVLVSFAVALASQRYARNGAVEKPHPAERNQRQRSEPAAAQAQIPKRAVQACLLFLTGSIEPGKLLTARLYRRGTAAFARPLTYRSI